MINPTTDRDLRARLARKPILIAPGVHNALSALVAEKAGFAALYVSGAAIAYTRLGRPDIGLLSLTDVMDTVSLMRDRVEAHLIVDADTGYGNALNVRDSPLGACRCQRDPAGGPGFPEALWPSRG